MAIQLISHQFIGAFLMQNIVIPFHFQLITFNLTLKTYNLKPTTYNLQPKA